MPQETQIIGKLRNYKCGDECKKVGYLRMLGETQILSRENQIIIPESLANHNVKG